MMMPWYLACILVGVFGTLFIMPTMIKIAFQEGGIGNGLAVWFGASLVPTAFVFFFYWLGSVIL